MLQVVNKDATHKASIVASMAQFNLAEDAIKIGMVVETVSCVIDTATFLAKEGLGEYIHHLQCAWSTDKEWLLETLCTLWDWVQLPLVSKALTEMVVFLVRECGHQGYSFWDLESASVDGMGGVWPE